MRSDITPGGTFPDYELPDHTKSPRKLSELQGDDPLYEPQNVDVDATISRSIDQSTIDAQSKKISVVHDGERGLQILGNGDLTKKITITAHSFSKSAQEKIAKAGGTAVLVAPPAAAAE